MLTGRPIGGMSPVGVCRTPSCVPVNVPSSMATSPTTCRSWTSTCASGKAPNQLPKNAAHAALPWPRAPPGASKTTSSASTSLNPSRSWALKVSVPRSNASRTVIVIVSLLRSLQCVPKDRREAAPPLEGGHPGLFPGKDIRELVAAFDSELRVRAREVALDRLQGHVELVGDLAVRAALRSKPHDAELAGRQRFDP